MPTTSTTGIIGLSKIPGDVSGVRDWMEIVTMEPPLKNYKAVMPCSFQNPHQNHLWWFKEYDEQGNILTTHKEIIVYKCNGK